MYDLLKLKEKGMKTPLAHARRFGSAHDGLHHWIMQRVTAIANLFLVGWLLVNGTALYDRGFGGLFHFLHHPVNAMLVIAFFLSAINHMVLGLQVVIEDYIHKTATKIALLLAVKFVGWGMLIVVLFSLAKITLGNIYVL